jgi:hypothetical protein
MINYYKNNEPIFKTNVSLAYFFVKGVLFLCQSKAYEILETLYLAHNNLLLRRKIIEALICGGGPKCLEVLEKILLIEKNKLLTEFINKHKDKIKITSI